MVITNDFSPYIFRLSLGGFELAPRWYGLAYVLGFVIGYMALKRAVRSGRLSGVQEKDLEVFLYLLIAGVILGGRLGFCLQNLDDWARDPLFFFQFQRGGMAFFGGLVGVVLAVLGFVRWKGGRFDEIGDVLALPAAVSLGFGRIANWINGELWGVPTGGSWGVIYPQSGTMDLRHPSELYEMLSHFVLAGVLVWVAGQAWGRRAGVVSACFVMVYGLLRIITEHFRSADTYIGPLTNGQTASLVIAVLGAVWLWRLLGGGGVGKTLTNITDKGNSAGRVGVRE